MKKTIRFDFTGDVQTITFSKYIKKIYIQAYGSKSATDSYNGGTYPAKGGYAYGTYFFSGKEDHILYIYIGGRNGWNGGGGSGNFCGGGATDIRLIKATDGSWYDTSHSSWETDKSLLSRIIVAGGAGSKGNSASNVGGVGGGLIGGTGSWTPGSSGKYIGRGGTQTAGGIVIYNYNALGIAGSGDFGCGGTHTNSIIGGGGGGWYGGSSGGANSYVGGGVASGAGGGGSSYIELLDEADRGTEPGINNGDGYILITYEYDTGSYFLEKNNKYYLPIKEYYDEATNSFVSVSIQEIAQRYSNIEYISPDELNNQFQIDGEIVTPSDIINFKEYKLCSLTEKDIYKSTITYTPSDTNLFKANIYFDISKEINKYDYVYTEIASNNVNTILNNKIEQYNLFNADSNLSKLSINTLSNIYKLINEDNIMFYKDEFDKYIKFNKDYNNILVNKTYKEKFVYGKETLETF